MAKEEPEHTHQVGNKLKVKLHDGRTVEATIRAIVDDGEKLHWILGTRRRRWLRLRK